MLVPRIEQSVFISQPSTVNRQPSTVNRQPSTVNHQPISITLCTVKPFIEAPLILDTKD
ncbi:MAG: hypothetical protein RMY62_027860 [Nostoc sp. ZfuVER08]|uniref:Uncharacterized protein n=1 Tax=Nostoc punctiforme FACHB-252 TaxID=1357509 RepID=A0ABR8HMK7_NOSPU|nr:hypothetical protein [Nostoc punctiforme]MBD2616476.1 hypothetical protein [Nostoc punctiforme FACHB-252]MDZ8013312.1 hypothetical protein [Nostoc sp. ZfuVER08]